LPRLKCIQLGKHWICGCRNDAVWLFRPKMVGRNNCWLFGYNVV